MQCYHKYKYFVIIMIEYVTVLIESLKKYDKSGDGVLDLKSMELSKALDSVGIFTTQDNLKAIIEFFDTSGKSSLYIHTYMLYMVLS